MLDSILRRAQTKTYYYGARYLKKLDRFSKRITDWSGFDDHVVYSEYLRQNLPGYVWNITHRCHKREFLLKFDQTRQRYIHGLYQARKRFGVEILNYGVIIGGNP